MGNKYPAAHRLRPSAGSARHLPISPRNFGNVNRRLSSAQAGGQLAAFANAWRPLPTIALALEPRAGDKNGSVAVFIAVVANMDRRLQTDLVDCLRVPPRAPG